MADPVECCGRCIDGIDVCVLLKDVHLESTDDKYIKHVEDLLKTDTGEPSFSTFDLAPWQAWYSKHAFCGGRVFMLVGRKGPYITCTCLDKEC